MVILLIYMGLIVSKNNIAFVEENFIYMNIPNILQVASFKKSNEILKKVSAPTDMLILITSYKEPLKDTYLKKLFRMLPENLINEVKRYRNWEDSYNTLFGKLLVNVGYFYFKQTDLDFSCFKRDKNNKPFLEGQDIAFNISHTGKKDVCILSKDNRTLGIDIEEVKEDDINAFESIFHPNELIEILKGESIQKFYKIWTRKEAFTKIVGKGIVMTLSDIDTTKEMLVYNNQNYYLKTYKLGNNYCSIAFDNYIKSKKLWMEVKF